MAKQTILNRVGGSLSLFKLRKPPPPSRIILYPDSRYSCNGSLAEGDLCLFTSLSVRTVIIALKKSRAWPLPTLRVRNAEAKSSACCTRPRCNSKEAVGTLPITRSPNPAASRNRTPATNRVHPQEIQRAEPEKARGNQSPNQKVRRIRRSNQNLRDGPRENGTISAP